jgi:hypothetical protein
LLFHDLLLEADMILGTVAGRQSGNDELDAGNRACYLCLKNVNCFCPLPVCTVCMCGHVSWCRATSKLPGRSELPMANPAYLPQN